jgi:hypothetical protein
LVNTGNPKVLVFVVCEILFLLFCYAYGTCVIQHLQTGAEDSSTCFLFSHLILCVFVIYWTLRHICNKRDTCSNNMDLWQNDTDRKTEVHGGTPVGIQLCLPQIPCGLAWDWSQVSTLDMLLCEEWLYRHSYWSGRLW